MDGARGRLDADREVAELGTMAAVWAALDEVIDAYEPVLERWAAIAIVPTIITGVYVMNFRHMPELGWPAGYPLVLLLIVAVVYGLRRYFRHSGGSSSIAGGRVRRS